MKFSERSINIEEYRKVLADVGKKTNDDALKQDMKLCFDLLGEIVANPNEFDNATEASRDAQAFESLIMRQLHSQDDIQKLKIFLSRVWREKLLVQGSVASENTPVGKLLNYYSVANPNLSGHDLENADYIWNRLPKVVFSRYAFNVDQKKKEIDAKIAEWDQLLGKYEAKVSNAAEILKQYHHELNFVSLAKSFNNLYKEKKDEESSILKYLIGFGISLTLPVAAALSIKIIKPEYDNLFILIPLATMEVILFYFFRLVLHNYHSVKAQKLQLELRQALCAFIESYVDFTKEKIDAKRDSLSKFEALIFSGLSPDLKNIPSTFDGLDQLASMIKEIKR